MCSTVFKVFLHSFLWCEGVTLTKYSYQHWCSYSMGPFCWAVELSYYSFSLHFLITCLVQYSFNGITVPLKICSKFLQLLRKLVLLPLPTEYKFLQNRKPRCELLFLVNHHPVLPVLGNMYFIYSYG